MEVTVTRQTKVSISREMSIQNLRRSMCTRSLDLESTPLSGEAPHHAFLCLFSKVSFSQDSQELRPPPKPARERQMFSICALDRILELGVRMWGNAETRRPRVFGAMGYCLSQLVTLIGRCVEI